MKKHFLSLIICCASISSFATVRTVSNVPANLAQFNTIQAAVNASTNGDTVYVHGSPNGYAAFTITNTRLTIMGPGWAPNKQLAFTALIAGCTLTGSGTTGTELHGLTFTSTITVNSNHPNDLRFIRNHFITLGISINEGGVTYSGYLFEGNIFDNSSADATPGSTYQNFLFQNNYFYESACCRDGNINSFNNSVNVLFNHNLWFGPASGTRNVNSGTSRFLSFTNNIFVRRNPATSVSSSTFNNNITFNAGENAPWNVNGNINSGGNVENQDPQMAAQAAVNAGTNNAIADYSIAAGPANNSATDGKDMGLLFDATGSLNWVNSRTSRLPFIFSMNITNPTVAPNASLQVVVEARKSN
ncbi:MAG: hypothetical protein V4722_14620 [Bacteroidota bacterium]